MAALKRAEQQNEYVQSSIFGLVSPKSLCIPARKYPSHSHVKAASVNDVWPIFTEFWPGLYVHSGVRPCPLLLLLLSSSLNEQRLCCYGFEEEGYLMLYQGPS